MNLKTLAVVATVATLATTAVVGVVYFAKKRTKAEPAVTPALGVAVEEPVAPVAETLKETDAKVVDVQVHTAEGVAVGKSNNVYSMLERSKKPKPQAPKPATKHAVPEYFRKTVHRAKAEGAN